MADENQTAAEATTFGLQQIEKVLLVFAIERRRWFVGNQQRGLADQGTGCGNTL